LSLKANIPFLLIGAGLIDLCTEGRKIEKMSPVAQQLT
jgi:hypothetical protein